MSQEGVGKLFVDFNKLDENSQRNKQGTGLGLSICKRFIEQMGGSVEVESEVGVGSHFIINVKTKCKVKKCKILDEDYQGSINDPFVFIKKGCDEEDQTLLIESKINDVEEGEDKKTNAFGKAKRLIEKLSTKLEY